MKSQFFAAFGLALLFSLEVSAQSVPSLINYQGRLTAQTGTPLAAGPYVIQFRLWNDPIANLPDNLIWSQQQSVTVQTNGTFDMILGSAAGSAILGDAPAFTNLSSAFGLTNEFLGITIALSNGIPVSNPLEIQPRQQLLSVPFAVQAQQALVAISLVSNLASALCPSGSIMAYMGTNAPLGWFICDGTPVSRVQYATLFSVIGTSSGTGDGATTFNLPDLRGMFLRGMNGGRSDGFADPDVAQRLPFAGGNPGNAVGSVQMDIFASHTHTFVDASLAGDVLGSGNTKGYNFAAQTGATGGTETRPKNIYVNYIIKY
jgi:microcystin-dependent protein